MKTLTSRAASLKKANAVKIVWLVEVDADAPNAASETQYYGSRKYTIGGTTYADALSPGGLQLGWQRIRRGGGLASVASARVILRNEARATELTESFFLENDEVRFYVIFLDGSEVVGDRIPLGDYVIENYPYTERTWTFELIDASDKDWRAIPADFINPTDYVWAPFSQIGRVLPVPFGKFDQAPNDLLGKATFIAPCINTNAFTQEYTSGLRNNAYSDAYQYYPSARKWAKCLNTSQSGAYVTINDATRQMLLSPGRKATSNTHSGYSSVLDRNINFNTGTSPTEHLDVVFAGTGGQLGTLTALSLVIHHTGPATTPNTLINYILKHGTTTIETGTTDGTANIETVDLADHIPTYFAAKWDFNQLTLELEEGEVGGQRAMGLIYEVYLDVRFDDMESKDLDSLPIYQDAEGFEDLTDNLADGAVITSSGAVLENPVHQLEAIFRGKNLLNMPTSKIDLPSFDAAATARDGWKFAFVMDQPAEIEFLNGFAYQAALHIFKDAEGKWNCAAQDKTTTPSHYFSRDNILVKNPAADPNQWEFDAKISRTNIREIINEVVLRYGLDRASGEYKNLKIATSRYRVSGTCTIEAPNFNLVDNSATFQTDGVMGLSYTAAGTRPGDRVYIEGDQEYEVNSTGGETSIQLTTTPNPCTNAKYWVGPNLSAPMVRSKTRYKTEVSLGDKFNFQTRRGGFTSDFINDDDTAQNLIDHIIDWRSQRRLKVEFATGLNAIDVELGDHCFFDHPFLPLPKRPRDITTLSAGVDGSTTTFPIARNIVKVGDFLLIDSEVVKVGARTVASGNITVAREQCNTSAAAHSSGATVKVLNRVQWEIIGIKPDLAKAQMRIEIQESPPNYQPVGEVVANTYPTYTGSTRVQRRASGYVSTNSGRQLDEDEYSDMSYVGESYA